MTEPEKQQLDVALLIDRFLSGTSSNDIDASLTLLLRGLQSDAIQPDEIYQETTVLQAFCQVLQQTTNNTSTTTTAPVVDHDSLPLIVRIYMELLNKCHKLSSLYKSGISVIVNEPSPGRLVETMIDIASDSSNTNTYLRVVCLQLLHTICKVHPKLAQQQLVQAPNGLHRLGDLFQSSNNDTAIPEQVRNEALLVGLTISKWPLIAKVWMFQEVGDTVMQFALAEGGLTGGNVIVRDCLQLLYNMVQHDASVADLIYQSPVILPSLVRFLDLRGGNAFRYPSKVKATAATTTAAPPITKRSSTKKDEDDLDDLIASGGSKMNKSSTATSHNKNGDTDIVATAKEEKPVVPYLTESEEKVIGLVFDLLSTVLENESIKVTVWKKHVAIGALLWNMGLLVSPPPGVPYDCAVPSILLQQRALHLIALYFSNLQIMELQHAALDRLLYIVCTGGGSRGDSDDNNKILQEKMQLQQSAIYVIRKTLTADITNQMLLNVLVPEMADDANHNESTANQPSTSSSSVVQKLLNTAYDNLLLMIQQQQNNKDDANQPILRKVLISGSLNGLSLFFSDEASRSIMYRITTPKSSSEDAKQTSAARPSLIDTILECLMVENDRHTGSDDNNFITLHLLRFLLSWMYEAPIVVQAMLSSPHAAVLSVLYTNNNNSVAVGALINCIFGLCMEYMGNDETQCGGWTKSSIMDMISSSTAKRGGGGGIGRFTSQLETLKTMGHDVLPWSNCSYEWDIWRIWYEKIVLIVRKRVVSELTSSGTSNDDDDDTEPEMDTNDPHNQQQLYPSETTAATSPAGVKKNQKSLQRLLSQQSNEIDELREQLVKANMLNVSQEKQIAAWKKRSESMPNELDEMLDEMTSKNADLDHKVMTLEEEIRLLKEKQQLELTARDKKINALDQELANSKEREDEMRGENETLHEEMAGLNQAYLSLEGEYRRQQADMSSTSVSAGRVAAQEYTPAGGETNENDAANNNNIQQHQPQGEESQQVPYNNSHHGGGSTEVSTLRAENGRLQSRLDEADNWIAMAVQRMNEMEAQSITLHQTIASLNEQHNVVGSELASTQQSIMEERSIREQLELTVTSTAEHLNHEKHSNTELQQQLDSIRSQMKVTEEDLASVRLERDRLRGQIDEFHANLNKGNDETSKEIDQNASFHLEGLQKEINSLRVELDNTRKHYQDIINERETRIAELDASLQARVGDSSSTDPVTSQDNDAMLAEIGRRDQEIAELRQANDAAQSWIDQALQHHQMLADTVNKLTEDNNHLQEQLSSVTRGSTSGTTDIVEGRESEITMLRSQVAFLQEELMTEQQKLNDVLSKSTEKDGAIDHSNADRDGEINRFLRQIEDRDTQIAALREELDAVKSRTIERQEVVSSPRKPREVQESVDRLHSLNGELEKTLEVVSMEKDRISFEMNEIMNALEQVRMERDSLKQQSDASPTMQSTDSNTQELKDTIKNLELQLVDQEEEHNCVISEWEETYSLLESDKKKVEIDLKSSIEERGKLEAALEDSKNRIQELSAELLANNERLEQALTQQSGQANVTEEDDTIKQEMPDRIHRLEATIQELTEQLNEQESQAVEIVAMWQQSYADIEQQLNAALQNQVTEVQNTSTEAPNVVELQQTIVDLRNEMESSAAYAEEVVIAWQNSYGELEKQYSEICNQKDGIVTDLLNVKNELERLRQSSLTSERDPIDESPSSGIEEKENNVNFKKIVKSLDKQLSEVVEDAEEAVQKWRSRCRELESQIELLQAEKTRKDYVQEDMPSKELETDSDSAKEIVENLTCKIEELENERQNDIAEFTDVVAQWEMSYADVEEQRNELILEVSNLAEELKNVLRRLDNPVYTNLFDGLALDNVQPHDADDSPTVPTEKEDFMSEDLHGIAGRIHIRLDSIEDQIKIVLDDRMKRSTELTAASEISVESKTKMDKILVTDVRITMENDRVIELKRSLQRLEEQAVNDKEHLQNIERNHSRIVNELKERVNALIDENEDMLATLKVSHESVDSMRTSYEHRIREVESELAASNQALEESNVKTELGRHVLGQVKEELDSSEEVSNLRAAVKSLEEQLADVTQEAEETVELWQESCRELEIQVGELMEEKRTAIRETKSGSVSPERVLDEVTSPETAEALDKSEPIVDPVEGVKDKIDILESERQQDADYFKTVVEQWQNCYVALERQFEDLTNENQKLVYRMTSVNEFVKALCDDASTLATEVTEGESVFNDQVDKTSIESDDSEILGQLRNRFETLAGLLRISSLEIKELRLDLSGAQASLAESRQRIEGATIEKVYDHSDVDQVTELEIMLQGVQEQLANSKTLVEETEFHYKRVIDDLQHKIDSSVVENERLQRDIVAKQLVIDSIEISPTSQDEQGSTCTKTDVAQLQLQCEELEVEVDALKQENSALASKIHSQHAVEVPNDEIQNLRLQLRSMEEQLADQSAQAKEVVGQWQQSYEMLMAEYEALCLAKDDLQAALSDYQGMIASGDEKTEEVKFTPEGQDQASQIDEEIVLQRKELEEAKAQLSQLTRENETLIGRNKILEGRVSSHMESAFRLEGELDKMKAEKSELHARMDQLKAEKKKLEVSALDSEREKVARLNAESRCATLEKKIAETENLFIARLETVTSEKDRMIDVLEHNCTDSTETAKLLESDVSALRADILTFENENERLEGQIALLTQELREANAAMQIFVTNGANEKASKSASEALRIQLDDIGTQLEDYKEALSTERETREKLERENEILNADLAALVGMENDEANKSEVQRRATEATERLHRKERAEIETLKEALSRSLNELNALRSAQRTIEDAASKASHEVVVYEQQLLASKNEFLFLTATLDEMRESESTRRASFEYRIESLETDVRVQRRRHASDMEILKNELNQVCMERDRLLQSLKESEKRREHLMNSSSRCAGDDDASGQALRRLQLEKAYLLSTSSEEASRVERRLREACVAQKSSMEADIILERELRFAAENSLESTRKELALIQACVGNPRSESEKMDSQKSLELVEQLQRDLQMTEEQLQMRTKENTALRERLETARKESHASIERLQLEAQQAKARVIHFERAGHFEAEVRAEQARLQASYANGSNCLVTLRGNNSIEEEKKDDAVVTKLYDYIKKQSQAIEEERSVYVELASKNEELLALLAQLDVLRNSLKTALIEHAGPQILEGAVRDAENKARAEFGRIVRFT